MAAAQWPSTQLDQLATQLLEPLGPRLDLDQCGGGLQGDDRRSGRIGVDRPDLLHVDAVDLADLGDQQVDEPVLGQRHDQLVDRPPGAPFEDLDADHVAADGADATGDLTERARPVGDPDANDVRPHRRRHDTAGRRRRMSTGS